MRVSAVHRPELIAGILSLDGGPAEMIGTPSFRRAMRFARVIRLGGVGLVRQQIRRQLESASGDASWITDEVVDGYTEAAARDLGATLTAFAEMARSEKPYRLTPLLSRVRCPVRLLVGTVEDRGGVPPDEIATLRSALARFVVERLPHVGHFVYEEQPDAVMSALGALAAEARRTVAAAS